MAVTPRPTARIKFRRYRRDDSEAVSAMFSDDQARRFYPDMGDPGRADGWIAWNLDNYAVDGFGLWVIERRDDASFLGDCGLTYQQVEGKAWLEVGYHLQEQHRGNGYATEAAAVCITHAFGVLAAPRVCSIVDPDNAASIRVASRLHQSNRAFTSEQGKPMVLYWSVRPTPSRHAGVEKPPTG